MLIIREQRALIRSLYKSLIVWGMPFSLKQLLNPIQPRLVPQFNLEFFKFDQQVEYCQKLFGNDNVKVLAYEYFLDQPYQFLAELHSFSNNSIALDKFLKNSKPQQKVNTGQTLLNLEIERWRNKFLLKSPFNALGLFTDDEARWRKRIARSKKNNLPALFDNILEKNFKEQLFKGTQQQFSASNQNLKKLIDIDLESFGYEL